MSPKPFVLLLVLPVTLGCDGVLSGPQEPTFAMDDEGQPDEVIDDEAPVDPDPEVQVQPIVPSGKQRVVFKGGERWMNDASSVLELDGRAICQELGTTPCLDVHGISLGGVEPYVLAIREPVPTQPLSAPLAVERLAWSLCAERVARDQNSADGMFSAVLASTATEEDFSASARSLISRALLRDPSEAELNGFVELSEDLNASDWSLAGCFAVLTHAEFLFY